jgi:hypothetical protein
VAYDEDLADRVRAVLAAEAVTERQMFGGLYSARRPHVLRHCQRHPMVRLGPDGAQRTLDRPHVRPMKGMVFVEPAGLHGPALREWVDATSVFARTLPPKPARGTASRERR